MPTAFGQQVSSLRSAFGYQRRFSGSSQLVDIGSAPGGSADLRTELMVDAALFAKAEAERHNERILGHVPQSVTIVDGRRNAPISAVRPGGTIIFLFAVDAGVLRQALVDAVDLYQWLAPVRTGHFRDTLRLFINERQTELPADLDNLDLKDTDTLSLTNLAPYARRLERGSSRQAPNGVFEVMANVLQSRFGSAARGRAGGLLSVRFGYETYPGYAVGTTRAGRALTASARRSEIDRAARYPTIRIFVR